MLKKLLPILLLSACTATKPIKMESPKLDVLPPKPIKLENVRIIIVNKDNAETIFQMLEEDNIPPVLFALTGNDYKNLSINLQKIQNYMKEQKKTLELYKKYYESK